MGTRQIIRFRDLHINIKARLGISFLQRLTQMMVFPFMMIYFSRHLGVEMAGILSFAAIAASILFSFYGGYYADAIGRKAVLVRTEQLRFATLVVMAAANSTWFVSPWLTYAMFFLNTVLVAVATPASEAIVIDVTTQETRKYVYGLSYWITNLCIAAGTMVGALLYEHYFFELLAASAAASLITWFVTARFIKESGPAKQLRQTADISFKRIVSSYQGVLRDKHFAQYLLVGILMLGLEMQLTGYIGVRLSESFVTQPLLPLGVLDMPVSGVNMLGILRTENTLLVVLFAGLLMRLSQRFSDLTLLCIGTVLFACGYALLAVSGIGWVLLLGTLIFSIGELLYVPVHQALLADLVQDSMRSQYMAVNALRLRGAMLLGAFGITVGALIPPWMMAAAYLLTGCCCLLLYTSLILRLREFRSSVMSSGSIEMNG